MVQTKIEKSSIQLAAAVNIRKIWADLIYNVKAYGAIGDSDNDDTASIQMAVDAIKVGGVLKFPPGDYLITSDITVTDKNVIIQGSGMGITNLIFSNCDGFTIDNSTRKHVQIETLSMTTNTLGTHTAIDFNGDPSTLFKQLFVQNVSFSGEDYGKAWSTGISIKDASQSEILDCVFEGSSSDISKMVYGIYVEGSSGVHIQRNYFNWLSTGVFVTGLSEGASVKDCFFVPCNYGIRCENNTGSYFIAENNHTDAISAGILSDMSLSQINRNLIFKNGASTASFIGINISGSRCSITDNDIANGGVSGGGNGIVINGPNDSLKSGLNVIMGNRVSNQTGSAILLDTHSERNIVTNNIGAGNLTNLFDQGTNNSLYNNTFDGDNAQTDKYFTETYDPGSIADSAIERHSVVILGADIGQFVVVSPPYDVQGIMLSATVKQNDLIELVLYNKTGSSVNLASGIWKYKLFG